MSDSTGDPDGALDGVSGGALEALLQGGYRYALALCGERADAEDLVHESWARLLAKYGQSIDQALLFRAIRNLYIDGYRHRRRHPTDSFDHVAIPLVDGTAQIEEPPDRALQAALSKLGSVERETLFLAVIEGWTATEIGLAIDAPRGTVLSSLHRCRRKLRDWLETADRKADPDAPPLTLVRSTRGSKS